jgi:hypothetical protein
MQQKIDKSNLTTKERKDQSLESKRKELKKWYGKENIKKNVDVMSEGELNRELKNKDKVEQQKVEDFAKETDQEYTPKKKSSFNEGLGEGMGEKFNENF